MSYPWTPQNPNKKWVPPETWPGKMVGFRPPDEGETPLSFSEVAFAVKNKLHPTKEKE